MKYKIKELMKADISKFYILGVGIICLLLVGGFFSYAMFTVSKERNNAISIVTGNLTYKLTVDGSEGNKLTVGAGETKEFTVVLSNPNNRTARFNFYYEGSLPTDVSAGYKTGDGVNTPPAATGVNLEKADASGSSNTYTIRVSNKSSSSVTITLGVQVGLDYNDLSLPDNGHLFEKVVTTGPVSDIVVDNLSSGDTYDDGTDTFITGEDPNNYIWYSGKLWRAVSVNNEAKTTKLVTQWNISTTTYNPSNQTNFEGSYMEDWLNDTTVDGFLGNLRDYENFIVTDAKWDATLDATSLGSITRPNGTTTVTASVGLLNMYEYQSSNNGKTNGYLNNGLSWWTLTPYSSSFVRNVNYNGNADYYSPSDTNGARPSINLKSSVKIVDGNGTVDNPYRLNGDNDTELSGTLLSSRYSGEYIKFGNEENNLYRIVSHENSTGTKIVSAEPLKDSGTFKTINFGSNTTFSSTNTVGSFLNGDYLTNYVGSPYTDMIEDSTTWYLGTVGSGTSYKLAKYTDTDMSGYTTTTDAKVGLLRFGELMSGQFDRYGNNTSYWTLTPYSSSSVRRVNDYGRASNGSPSNKNGARPSMNLKSNVQIVNGDGTLNSPFEIQLGS
ncbi:MAG TPA: hypothetical protein IAB38_01170 [Candidatus Onthousia excrementipullorum]|uniref:Uncharacterized protein n=1 Tax=Candidatus Onthousia excrementipullorum TaxID=2840884 RepID=A0A9D1DTM9_9FIRM|nr:hypothetical protein [Candidatus Onthousia excrementipullorum]